MKPDSNRRSFLKKAALGAAAIPMVKSLEEYALAEQQSTHSFTPPVPGSKNTLATGTIGKVKMSRILCGGNLISGYAHSRDLIYVSNLLKNYFSEEKIMETWSACEQHGINTMVFNPDDKKAVAILKKYRAQGGKIQFLAQIAPAKTEISACVQETVDNGAVGAVLVGNLGDAWTRDNAMDRIGEFVQKVQAQKLIASIGGHELRTPMSVEKAGIKPDFYMKTLHSTNYWSKRQPDQKKEVIDNYGIDNYWCMDPDATIRFMQELDRPWIAYKVLAAGAIHPKEGFKHAFENGADFCVVGMFDFQVADDVNIAKQVLAATQNRDRKWCA